MLHPGRAKEKAPVKVKVPSPRVMAKDTSPSKEAQAPKANQRAKLHVVSPKALSSSALSGRVPLVPVLAQQKAGKAGQKTSSPLGQLGGTSRASLDEKAGGNEKGGPPTCLEAHEANA